MSDIIQSRYAKHLHRIRNKKGPIKVYFHVNKSSKWSYKHLFELMRAHPRFEPAVYIMPEVLTNDEHADHQGQCEKLCRFFTQRNMPYRMGYDMETRSFLDMFSDPEQLPDIVFYTQLWDTVEQDLPASVSQQALTCDCLYHAAIAHYGHGKREKMYYSALWRFFASTPECRQRHLELFPTLSHEQVILTGWPRLDAYYTPLKENCHDLWPSGTKNTTKIIWAPHWTLYGDRGTIRYGTFSWSAPVLLDLARQYSQIDWVVKPHPTLWKIIGRENGIIKQFLELPNVALYDDGDYYDLFRSSDALIADSVSFLAEYLPTGNPVIRISDETTTPLLPPGPEIVDAFYQARTADEIRAHFINVIINHDDPMFLHRMAAKSRYYMPIQPAGQNIFEHLLETLHV